MASDSCQKGRGDTGLLSKLHQSPTNPGAESAPPNVKTASSASRDNAKAKPTGVARRAACKVDKWPPSGEVYGAKWWYTRDWHAKFGGPKLELQVHYDSLASKENFVRIPFVCIYSLILMLLEYGASEPHTMVSHRNRVTRPRVDEQELVAVRTNPYATVSPKETNPPGQTTT
ncbi:hypothetical protein C8Q80DRAFT_1341026, partial [Daedaleopsis nitida]